MNSENIILRETNYPPLTNKNDYLDSADFDANFINVYEDLKDLFSANGVDEYNNAVTYDDTVIQYASLDGKLYQWVNPTPGINVTPGTNELYWLEISPSVLAHRKNSDTILAEGTADEVTANEIRMFIDAGLTSTTNLSLSEQTDVSLKINSSTGSDVTLLGATETTAGLLISEDKQKLNQLEGINSGDQTLESLGAEATANKVIDFSVIDNITFPTTEAVANKITSDVVDLVDAQLTNYATTEQLATKENTITAGTTSQYWRGDKSWQTLDKTAVGLGNVVNIDTTNASNLASGIVPTARLGSGTADSTTYLKGDNTWASISLSIPQANKIYVDSINGVDSTGRGRIDAPYLSVEYALSNITNTGTITATTTSSSATLTAVSSTTNIVIGQYITGTGIPFNTTVVSKTSNTITLSQNCTASATITATWWTIYELNLNGNFTATGNWFKAGFWFGNSSSNVYWGAFTLYNVNAVQLIPYNNFNNISYYGTTSSSVFYANINYVHDTSFIANISFNEIYSKTTDYIFQDGSMAGNPVGTLNVSGNKILAYFGKIASLSRSFGNRYFNITYSYGLLGGVDVYYGIGYNKWVGDVSTPSSIYAVNTMAGYASNFQYIGNVVGSVRFVGANGKNILNANISGTNCYLQNCTFYGSCPTGTTLNGGVNFYGSFGSNAIYNASGYNKFFSYTDGYNLYITSGTADIQVESSLYYLSISSGGKLIINAPITITFGLALSSGSEILNNSDFSIPGMTIGGTFENRGKITNVSGYILIPSGGKLINKGVIKTSQTSTTIPLIQKDGGALILQYNSHLIVSNSKSPIKCTANTSASKDIYLFNCIDNCDGSTYGLAFAFDGSSFSPNDLVGGTKFENTTYTF
jgi:hypothetical protein